MSNFVFALPTRVIFGAGAIDSVGEEAAALGRRGMLVTGSTFARRSGLIERLRNSLTVVGTESTVYDRFDQNPTVGAIDEGARLAREEGAEFIVGVGGGSALDAAKAIACTALSGHSVWEFARHDVNTIPRSIDTSLPVLQVPLIASTGSETSDTAVVFHEPTGVRAPISSSSLFARTAIVDPTVTFSVPAHYTAVGAMNIISQMLETYLTSDEFAAADRVTEGLVRVVMDSLSRAVRHGEDLDARANLSWAAAMASTVTLAGRKKSTPLRALAYPLTARCRLEHGSVLAALWPSFMRYSLANRLRLPQVGRFKRYALLGRQIFGVHETDDEVAAETTVYRYVSWLRSMNMPTDLQQLGVVEENLVSLADQAVTVSGNGRRLSAGLSVEDVDHIYEGALRPFL